MSSGPEYDAIVLAGGGGRRLGGVDKANLAVGGRTLLERVLAAVVDAGRVVVVGPARSLPSGVLSTTEQPPGGGPVAGLAAGLDLVQAPLVAVLACDLPFVTSDTVQALIAALEPPDSRPVDGAQLVDELGHRQPLAAVYRTDRLRGALYSLLHVSNASMRAMLGGVTMVDVAVPREQAWDCDTWADLDRARQRVDENPMEEP